MCRSMFGIRTSAPSSCFQLTVPYYQSCLLNSAWSAGFTRAQISVILQTHHTTDSGVGMQLVTMEWSSAIHIVL